MVYQEIEATPTALGPAQSTIAIETSLSNASSWCGHYTNSPKHHISTTTRVLLMMRLVPRPEWQCQYRGGVCTVARAVKDDGSLHHLCPEHRHRANLNQRRSQERRRRMRRRLIEAAAAAANARHRDDHVKRRNQGTARWCAVESDVRHSATAARNLSGMPLMSDSELFAPMLADLPPFDNEAEFVNDLFHVIGSEEN